MTIPKDFKPLGVTELPDNVLDAVKYCENSPSCLIWNYSFQVGKFKRIKNSTVGNLTRYSSRRNTHLYYWKFGYKYNSYTNHRIVWSLFNGEIPENYVINHVNNDSTDNRITNLELVTVKTNNQKTSQHSNLRLNPLNNTGILGVSDNVKIIKGVVYSYAHAQYRDETGKKVQKYFKYEFGNNVDRVRAFREANEWRISNLIKLTTELDANYDILKLESWLKEVVK